MNVDILRKHFEDKELSLYDHSIAKSIGEVANDDVKDKPYCQGVCKIQRGIGR